MKAWVKIMHSKTEKLYEENWTAFQNAYDHLVPGLVQYIKDTWIVPWKRSIIQAYTNRALHLGNRVTSRIEGAHSTIKSYLQVSTGNLKMVYDSISLLLTNQLVTYEAGVAMNKARIPHIANHAIYAQLLGRISHHALGKIWEQKLRLTSPDPLPPCTQAFRSSMGPPCAHEIQVLLRENRPLTLEEVHPHWYFLPRAPEMAQPLVLEPAVAETKGRPAAASKERCPACLNRAARARQVT